MADVPSDNETDNTNIKLDIVDESDEQPISGEDMNEDKDAADDVEADDVEADAADDVEADAADDVEADAADDVEVKPTEEEPIVQQSKKRKIRKNIVVDIFHNNMITKKISVPIHNVGKNIRETLEKIIANEIEGKCIAEGYVKENSTRIMTYSCGVVSGNNIVFDVVFECMICLPVEGMHINCVAKNITKAGIRAETEDTPSPVVIFVARDHNATNNKFAKVTPGRKIKIRVIGQRYELNDKYISIIAELIDSNVGDNQTSKRAKKLTLKKK